MPREFDLHLCEELIAKGILKLEQKEKMMEEIRSARARGESTGLLELLIAQGYVCPPGHSAKIPAAAESGGPPPAEPPTRVISREELSPQPAQAEEPHERPAPVNAEEQFEFVESLGDGGMGPVYRARHSGEDKFYAVRKLPKANGKPGADVESVRREIEAASSLEHPNIARVHKLVQLKEGPAVVCEYLEGITVNKILKKKRQLAEAQAAEIVAQVTLALEHASGKGIVHKNIGPTNILLTREGQVYLLDYGLRKEVRSPQYMSLEQCQGRKKLDIRSDIYSLGITFYEMLAGKPPFDGENSGEILEKHFREMPPDLRGLNPEVSPATWRVIRKMLGKGRRDRYQTAEELLDALEEIIEEATPGEGHPQKVASENAAARAPQAAPPPPTAAKEEERTPAEPVKALAAVLPAKEVASDVVSRAAPGKPVPPQQGQPAKKESYDDLDVDELFGDDDDKDSVDEEDLKTLTPTGMEKADTPADLDTKHEADLAREKVEGRARVRYEEDEEGESGKPKKKPLRESKAQEEKAEKAAREVKPAAAPARPASPARRRSSLFAICIPLAAVFLTLGAVYLLKQKLESLPSETEGEGLSSTQPQETPPSYRYTEEDARKLNELKANRNREMRKHKNLLGWMQRAEDFYRKHPNNFWMTRSLLEQVLASSKETELEGEITQRCQTLLDELNRREQESAENVIRKIREKAELLVAQGNYGDAIQLYYKIPEEERSATVETFILIETEKLESQAVRQWEEARAKVKELTAVEVVPIEEQVQASPETAPASMEGGEMQPQPAPAQPQPQEDKPTLFTSKASTLASLEMEFAPSVEEVDKSIKLVEPFQNYGIHKIVVGARDYIGALRSLRSQILEYQGDKNQVIEAKTREESKRLYAELASKSEKLLGQLKVWEVQKLCNDALADPRYSYHTKRIQVLGKEAQAMADILSLAKPHLSELKDTSIKVGSVVAKVENLVGDELVMIRGETRFRRTVADLEPALIIELARKSANDTDGANLHRSLAIFAYYTGGPETASEEFKLAQMMKADVNEHIDIITKIEVAVRDARERKAIAEAYAKAQKLYEQKQWAVLKPHLIRLRLSYNDSQHFKKIEEQVLDWIDIAYDNLEGDQMVFIPAGSYKNSYDEPVGCNPFKIDIYEVSNRKYNKFLRWLKKSGSHIFCHPMEKLYGQDGRFYMTEEAMRAAGVLQGAKDHAPIGFNTYVSGWEDFPVVSIDWLDAYAYSRWARKRLPTPNEFVRAMCGNDYREFPWGKTWKPELCNANDGGFSDGSLDGFRGLAAVHSFEKGKSPFGIFNLSGNVREFLDEMDMNMGGSFGDGKTMCSIRSTSRLLREDGLFQRLTFVGFRCVKDP